MQRLTYSHALKNTLQNHPDPDKPLYRRPLLWVTLIALNIYFSFSLFYGYGFSDLRQLLPKVHALSVQPSTHMDQSYQHLFNQIQELSTQVDPENALKQSLSSYISRSYRIANDAALDIVDSTFTSSEKYKIDPVLMLAIIAQESRFNPISESSVGALGLTQALPVAHPEKIQDIQERSGHILNVADNVDLGARIYAEYLKRYKGDKMMALQQYNGNTADRSQAYAKKVLSHYDKLNAARSNLQIAKK